MTNATTMRLHGFGATHPRETESVESVPEKNANEGALQELEALRAELKEMLADMEDRGLSREDYSIALANYHEARARDDAEAASELMHLRPFLDELRPKYEALEHAKGDIAVDDLRDAVKAMHNDGIRLTAEHWKDVYEKDDDVAHDVLTGAHPLLALAIYETKPNKRPSIADMTVDWALDVLGVSHEGMQAFDHGFAGEKGFEGPEKHHDEQVKMFHLGRNFRDALKQHSGH